MIWEEAKSLFFFDACMINKEDIKKVRKEKIEEIGGFFVDIKINLTNSISLYF